MANNGKVQSRKHISIMIRHFCPITCETDTGIRLHCCGLQKRPPSADTRVAPDDINKKPSLGICDKGELRQKKAPQKYANWQIDIRFGLETVEMAKNARSWLGRWRWVELLIIMCPVIANNDGSGSLVSLLASPWLTSSVIFNWLVLSPQKENPLMNIHIYLYRWYSYGRRALLRSNCVPDSTATLLCCVSFLVCVELCAKCWRFWFQILIWD